MPGCVGSQASALSLWYERRFAHHGKHAEGGGGEEATRKLLVASWKYLDWGEIPACPAGELGAPR